MKFIIQGRLDGLNEYIKECRKNKYAGNLMKKRNENIVKFAIKKANLKEVTSYPVSLNITFYEPNKRRDLDNIVFSTKFIQDALVYQKILKNDNQTHVCGLSYDVKVDKDNPRIEVEIKEASS